METKIILREGACEEIKISLSPAEFCMIIRAIDHMTDNNSISPEDMLRLCRMRDSIRDFKTEEFSVLSEDRILNILQSYVRNDAEGLAETSLLYESLSAAGADNTEIEALGFGYCIP